jgi:hypothetical protein
MFTNSININKTNKTYLTKENTEQSPFTFSMNTKKTTTCDFGNRGPGLRQVQQCGRVKQVNGIPTLSS